MTRINTIDPVHLTNEWLLAEWRELPRIVNELIKHPNRFKLKDIPNQYTLNTGHVKFFRNKLDFLQKRHNKLIEELKERGVNVDPSVTVDLFLLPDHIKTFSCNDWKPTKADHRVLIDRLKERVNLRKKDYAITANSRKTTLKTENDYTKYFNNLEQTYLNCD